MGGHPAVCASYLPWLIPHFPSPITIGYCEMVPARRLVASLLALLALLPVQASAVDLPGPRLLAPVTDGDRRFGVAEAFRTSQTTLTYDAGVKWSRLSFPWTQLEPGYWNGKYMLPFAYLDNEINHDVDLAGMLINTPDNVALHPELHGASPPRGLYLAFNDPGNVWGQFVTRAARYYHGRIWHWVIWNEPDVTPSDTNGAWVTWRGSVEDYYQLLKVAYQAIKSVDPRLSVHTAGFTYWSDKVAGRRQFFDRLLDVAANDPTAPANAYYFDVASLHLYSDPHTLYDVPRLYHSLMQAHGFDKPVWVNETNVIPYDDPVNAGQPWGVPGDARATLEDQSAFILQALALGMAGGAERIEVYKMKDGDGDVVNGQALVRATGDGAPRPAYVSFQLATRYFSHATAASYYRVGDLEQVILERGKQRVTLLWSDATIPVAASVRATGTNAALFDKYGNPVPVSRAGDAYQVQLAPANPANLATSASHIGGSPMLLVEDGPSPAPNGPTLRS